MAGWQLQLLWITLLLSTQAQASRWVVVTSIAPPTPIIRKLAALTDWNVVVVADRKTPTDWKHDNVTFLSVEKQEASGFSSLKHVPWNNYGRKNLGYLYAISKGARVIYETDDDNELIVDEILQLTASENILELTPPSASGAVDNGTYTVLDVDCPMNFNPYPLFGQGQMWPRGLPVESIKDPVPTCFIRQPAKPLIQQGLANNDPDVDAIYRLTLPLNVSFDEYAFSVVLPHNVTTPFNSQNTLFLHDALWAMVIPVTTTMRVCDIWRGYWAQRLLWDIGGHLAFIPATVVQHRNPHTVFRDMLEEADLYEKGGALVRDLTAWRGTSSDLPGRMVELAEFMAKKDYWKQADVELMKAWVADLKKAGYKFPALVQDSNNSGKAAGDGGAAAAVAFATAPSNTTLKLLEDRDYGDVFHEDTDLRHRFLLPQRWCINPDVVLIVNFNHFKRSVIPDMKMLHAAYRPYFRHVFFTGVVPAELRNKTIQRMVNCESHNRHGFNWMPGHFAYVCAAEAMAQTPLPTPTSHANHPETNFLYINDDVIISPCMLGSYNSSRIWYDPAKGQSSLSNMYPADRRLSGWWYDTDFSAGKRPGQLKHHLKSAMRNAFGWMSDRMHLHAGNRQDWKEKVGLFDMSQADFYYIPSRLARHFIDMAHQMRAHFVLSEVAVPNMLGLMIDGQHDIEYPAWEWVWDDDRKVMIERIKSVLPLGRNISWQSVRECRKDQKNDWHTGPLIKVSSPDLFAVHPVKLSDTGAKAQLINWVRSQQCPKQPNKACTAGAAAKE